MLPVDLSCRHYLSIGLTLSLILFELAFVIPLGARLNFCYDAITPNDMYTDLSCAWSGALLEFGGLSTVVWILLRSTWTMLRVVWDFKRTELFKWVSIAASVCVPGLLLGVGLTFTGVSYRAGSVCFPNTKDVYSTWFAWLLCFAILAAFMTIGTVLYAFWVYARTIFMTGERSRWHGVKSGESGPTPMNEPTPKQRHRFLRVDSSRGKRVAWKRVSRILRSQWRSLLLAFVVINLIIFFSSVFDEQTQTKLNSRESVYIEEADLWSRCLIHNGGDKNECLHLATMVGVSENRVIGVHNMAAVSHLFLT